MKGTPWYWVLALCLTMFVGVIAAHGHLGQHYEVTINDILVLVLPFLLWMFATGQISSFELGGEKLTIKAVFAKAVSRPIKSQISEIPVQSVSAGEKGNLSELPTLLEKKIEALSLHVNKYGYYIDSILREYIENLVKQPTFKWLIISDISDESGKFLGAIDMLSKKGTALLDKDAESLKLLVAILNKKQPASNLAHLPGFVPETEAVSSDTDKQTALDRMEKSGVSWLPVVNTDGQFIGVVDRGRLTASFILDVSRALQATMPVK